MNENTTRVESTVEKFEAGHYVSFTWGGSAHTTMASGAFHFHKSGKGWVVTHRDFTDKVSQDRTYDQVQPTLKAAQAFAQSVVRDLPANVARRREAALKGAMPISTHSPVSGALELRKSANRTNIAAALAALLVSSGSKNDFKTGELVSTIELKGSLADVIDALAEAVR